MTAKAEANKIIKEYCITSPFEIHFDEILTGEMIYYEEAELSEELGRIVYSDNCGIMTINKNIIDSGQKRFTIAHELGHYKLQNKNNSGCTNIEMLMHDNNLDNENESNKFAAELLMHEPWFRNYLRGKRAGKETLINTAEYFKVSCTAAGIRFTELDIYPMAVIFSKNGKVEWKSISKSFPMKWLPKGYRVNDNSAAYDIFEKYKKGNFLIGKEFDEVNEVSCDAWFKEDMNYDALLKMYEQNIAMPNYNAVLTILWR
jgi:Zn-dependent peptidase ImmA (M78 family)